MKISMTRAAISVGVGYLGGPKLLNVVIEKYALMKAPGVSPGDDANAAAAASALWLLDNGSWARPAAQLATGFASYWLLGKVGL